MLNWPPIKAWTSLYPIKGSIYFVAINYGGEEENRWVNLVCVVDGSLFFRVLFEDLNNIEFWLPGWQETVRENYLKEKYPAHISKSIDFNNVCLHPSDDSGLLISSDRIDCRPWFISPKD